MSYKEELEQLISRKAEKSGFRKMDSLTLSALMAQAEAKQPGIMSDTTFEPGNVSLDVWQSSYALIFLQHISENTVEAFTSQMLEAERRLDLLLVGLEGLGRVYDGYLILALTCPCEDLCQNVTNVEQNTRLVRKNVVWFKDGEWCRTERIGALGLDAEAESEIAAYPPGLDPEGIELIEALENSAGTALARQHATEWDD
ncbi:hypothetical protein [Pectobacterium cacticida]|uniref:hypothetical protein n=1 Tax=Pectobacterium cacticida TaxID=69221 RepID=UPI002FF1F914